MSAPRSARRLVCTALVVAVGLHGTTAAGRSVLPPALVSTGIENGDFGTGDLRGFRGDRLQGAMVDVVRRGDPAWPDGPAGDATYGVALRARGGPTPPPRAMLTTLPFLPGAPELEFRIASRGAPAEIEVLFIDPRGDTFEPAAADVQGRRTMSAPPSLEVARVPFPAGLDPTRVQFRVRSASSDPRDEAVVLVTGIRAGAPPRPPDRDGDTVPDAFDNCITVANRVQSNVDGDRFGDACDTCPYTQDNDQADRDGDGVGNRCAIDVTADGWVDEEDVDAFAAAAAGTYDPRCDFDDDGRVGLVDLALFARSVRVGIATDDLWDFTFGFVDHSIDGGLALAVPRGMVVSALPESDLIMYPGPAALMVRSGTLGDPASVGVVTSRPFVPRGPRLSIATLSESPDVAGTVRVLRATRTPATPRPEDVLVEVPLRNDRPGSGPSAHFEWQTIDLGRWFDPERPLRNDPIQVQFRQHTTRRGSGFFTLIGDVRTGP